MIAYRIPCLEVLAGTSSGGNMGGSFADGIQLYANKKYADALQLFLSLPSDTSGGIEFAYYVGLCYARLEKYEDALLYLEQVVTSEADLRRARQCRLVLAILYSRTGRVRLADYELRKLVESGYQTVHVLSALAYTASEQDKLEEAIDLYEQALHIDSENPTALNGLGYMLACVNRDLTRALSLCKQALDMKPDSPAFLDSIGWVYYKLGLSKEARKYLKRAKDRQPGVSIITGHFKTVHDQISGEKDEDRFVAFGGKR